MNRACCLALLLSGLPAAAPSLGAAVAGQTAAARSAVTDDLPRYHAQMRETVGRILASREFAPRAAQQRSWWRRFADWLAQRMDGVRSWLGNLSTGWFWALLIWLLLALLAILAHLIYTIVKLFGGGAAGGRAGDRRLASTARLTTRELGFEAAFASAQERFRAGDWSAAIRNLYVAAILWLDRRGVIRYEESKTNRDYVLELAADPRRQSRFRALTDRFELTVYGGRPADARVCGEMLELVSAWRDEAPAS